MPRHAMTPHYSGTTLDAQERYAKGVKEILRRFLDGEPQNKTDIICDVRSPCPFKMMPLIYAPLFLSPPLSPSSLSRSAQQPLVFMPAILK